MKNKIIFACVALVLLVAAFFLGDPEQTVQPTEATTSVTTEPTTQIFTSVSTTLAVTTEAATETTTLQLTTSPPTTVEETRTITEATTETTTLSVVYLSVDYKVLVGRYEGADANGGIVYTGTHDYYQGQTAFDLLQEAMEEAGIPMEFSQTPAYNSVYIEGIDNVYEFDFGELSGWTYRVNGVFSGYSSSSYVLSPGDRVEFMYTRDFGRDVGNTFSIN